MEEPPPSIFLSPPLWGLGAYPYPQRDGIELYPMKLFPPRLFFRDRIGLSFPSFLPAFSLLKRIFLPASPVSAPLNRYLAPGCFARAQAGADFFFSFVACFPSALFSSRVPACQKGDPFFPWMFSSGPPRFFRTHGPHIPLLPPRQIVSFFPLCRIYFAFPRLAIFPFPSLSFFFFFPSRHFSAHPWSRLLSSLVPTQSCGAVFWWVSLWSPFKPFLFFSGPPPRWSIA